ncbi:MAG: hypothetical protein HQK73_12380 [Desulfamplus sp.]|nr:hypothetical protein [Desulfamplus sp.]
MEENSIPKRDICRLSSLSPRVGDTVKMLHSLAELYVSGVDVDWRAFDKPFCCSKAVLPNYPFQRERHWIDRADKKVKDDKISSIKPERSKPDKPAQSIRDTIEIEKNKINKIDKIEGSDNKIISDNRIEGIMIQQIQTMNQLMKRHLEMLKK